MQVSFEKKKVYAHSEFQDQQSAHHALAREKLVAAAGEIKEVMAAVHKVRALGLRALGRRSSCRLPVAPCRPTRTWYGAES